MAYHYNGTETIAAAEQRRQQLQTELLEARQAYKTAQKLARENQRLEAQIIATQQRAARLAKPLPTMPEPIYGGPAGLRRATQEIAEWERRKKAA